MGWDIIEKTLLDEYDWEMASDTVTSWRIGDGTAAFYNYIFYTVAGLPNMTHSGAIKSGKAKCLVARRYDVCERKTTQIPEYAVVPWYSQPDFSEAVKVINEMPKIWRSNQ